MQQMQLEKERFSMWAVIGTLLTSILPLLVKLVLYILERRENSDKLKEEFLKFISEIEKDIPVKLHSKYNAQIERLKEKYRQEQVGTKNVEDACHTWREGYEDLLKKHEALIKEFEDFKNEQK